MAVAYITCDQVVIDGLKQTVIKRVVSVKVLPKGSDKVELVVKRELESGLTETRTYVVSSVVVNYCTSLEGGQ